jgi:uncharacterized protein YycO
MIDQIVEKYIALRDQKAQFKAEYEAKVAEIEQALDRIERHLLEKMQEQGLKSMPTAAGTAYIQHRTAATVADWDSLLGFIRQNEAWTMLEKRVSKSAVEEYKAANDEMPPGINWNESIVVNVKRS